MMCLAISRRRRPSIMLRKKLIQALDLMRPLWISGLPDPLRACYFSSESVECFNDYLHISIGMDVETIRGGIVGKELLNWLKSVKGEEISQRRSKKSGDVTLISGSSKLSVSPFDSSCIPPLQEVSDSLVDPHGNPSSIMRALRFLAPSIPKEPGPSQTFGVTAFQSSSGNLVLSTITGSVAQYVSIAEKVEFSDFVSVAPDFVKLLLKVEDRAGGCSRFAMSATGCSAFFEGLDCYVRGGSQGFGKLTKVLDYYETLVASDVKHPFPITAEFAQTIASLSKSADTVSPISLELEGGRLDVELEVPSGRIRHSFEVPDSVDDISVKLSPTLFDGILTPGGTLCLGESYVVVRVAEENSISVLAAIRQ